VLTIEDVRAIPPFFHAGCGRTRSSRQHIRRPASCAREFAVHEGGERALYAVLSGRIEVVKLIDGIEKTLGWRVPGTVFGDVMR
jgi:thioredoxin reductase (NADPH)